MRLVFRVGNSAMNKADDTTPAGNQPLKHHGDPLVHHESTGPEKREGCRIVIAVTGGIACYKACTVVSRLAQRGCEVRVVMTEAATRFVAPLTFESLSGHAVITDIWSAQEFRTSQHVGLARWAQLFVVAPCTANSIAKFAGGFCDDPVSLIATALPQQTPAFFAPAMNADMWASPIVAKNVKTVRETLGWQMIGPEEGWQACRTKGIGRMSEPEKILQTVEAALPSLKG